MKLGKIVHSAEVVRLLSFSDCIFHSNNKSCFRFSAFFPLMTVSISFFFREYFVLWSNESDRTMGCSPFFSATCFCVYCFCKFIDVPMNGQWSQSEMCSGEIPKGGRFIAVVLAVTFKYFQVLLRSPNRPRLFPLPLYNRSFTVGWKGRVREFRFVHYLLLWVCV